MISNYAIRSGRPLLFDVWNEFIDEFPRHTSIFVAERRRFLGKALVV